MTEKETTSQPETDIISKESTKGKRYGFARKALTAVNFFVETNRLEHYTAVYLVDIMNWSKVDFGIVSLVMNVVMVIFQTPAGDLLDKTTKGKKIITTLAIITASFTTVMVVWTSNFWAILVGKMFEGISSTIFLPALMSLLLGISQTDAEVPSFIATTEVSNKVGSFLIVTACAVISYFAYPNIEAMFYLLGAGGLAAAFFTFIIPESAIDHNRARQLGDSEDESVTENDLDKSMDIESVEDQVSEKKDATPSRYLELLKNRDIFFFAVLTFFYHFANAGPGPLLAQYVASITSDQASLTWTSAILIAYFLPQAMTAFLMRYAVDRFSHKRIMIVAFVTVPVRCFAIALMIEYFQNPWALTASMSLEGIGAGVYDVMIPIVVQQLTKGSGRFGFTFGFICAMWRIGHGVSVFFAEVLVQSFNYTVSFTTLGVIGMVNLIVFVFFFKLDTGNEPAKNKDNKSDRRLSSTQRRMSSSQFQMDRRMSSGRAQPRSSFIAAGSSSMFVIEAVGEGEESDNEIDMIKAAQLVACMDEGSDEEVDPL